VASFVLPIGKLKMFISLEHSKIADISSTFTLVITSRHENKLYENKHKNHAKLLQNF